MSKEKNEREDRWIGEVKDRLRDYSSEGTGSFDWSKLDEVPVPVSRRPLKKWLAWGGGAIAVAACIALVFILRNPHPTAVPALGENITVASAAKVEGPSKVEIPGKAENAVLGGETVVSPKCFSEVLVNDTTVNITLNVTGEAGDSVPEAKGKLEATPGSKPEKYTGKELMEFEEEGGTRRGKKKVISRQALSFAYGNSYLNGSYGMKSMDFASASDCNSVTPGLESGGVYDYYLKSISEESSRVLLEGVDYTYLYEIPVTYMFSIRDYFDFGLFLETGICYTRLGTTVLNGSSVVTSKQVFHYLGVPLKVGWSFLNTRYFSAYLSAGVAAEKCIYAINNGNRIHVKQMQYSASASLGFQFNFNEKIGLFAEPAYDFYPDDGSSFHTSRKENPQTFTLTAGLRFSFR
ncbi:MAG: porin family protein [Bacteroidales bacterium]|nr:porin family protein [Bacteroidales bacterium]MCI2121517.1 porin family protein [Bacteroidales bacterium]MCI2145541.1 porin family protein [Bacteroidales bacterium]